MSQLTSRQLTAAEEADRFRLAFFQGVIVEEEKREREIKKKQRMCHHRYEFAAMLQTQAQWICSRCDHVIQRTLPKA